MTAATLTAPALPDGSPCWPLSAQDRWADSYTHLVIRAGTDLTDDEAENLAALLGYAWTTIGMGHQPIGGQVIVWTDRRTMICVAPITRRTARTRDHGTATRDMLELLTRYATTGTPTRQRGPHAGTQLVPALLAALPLTAYVDQRP